MIIADLIIKVEYITISEAAKEAFWFKKFIAELRVMPPDAIALYCNNNDVIALAKEPMSHQKSKHRAMVSHHMRIPREEVCQSTESRLHTEYDGLADQASQPAKDRSSP